jgi:hypothetical protein
MLRFNAFNFFLNPKLLKNCLSNPQNWFKIDLGFPKNTIFEFFFTIFQYFPSIFSSIWFFFNEKKWRRFDDGIFQSSIPVNCSTTLFQRISTSFDLTTKWIIHQNLPSLYILLPSLILKEESIIFSHILSLKDQFAPHLLMIFRFKKPFTYRVAVLLSFDLVDDRKAQIVW